MTSRDGNRSPRPVRPLKGEKPPYAFCWLCSRKFHGGRGVAVEVDDVKHWVHACCRDEMERDAR